MTRGSSSAGATGTIDNIPLALLGWVAGCALVWSALFTVGSVLYGETSNAVMLGAVVVVSGLTVLWLVQRLWAADVEQESRAS